MLNFELLNILNSGGSTLIYMLLIFIVFYFFIIRPQVRRQKKENEFRENLKKGDKIITIGGIHGKIVGVQETIIFLEIEDGRKIKIDKTAIIKSVKQ